MVEVEEKKSDNADPPQVRISEKYLSARLLALETQQEQIVEKYTLTSEMAVKQPLEAEFNCSICYNVVKKPRQCKECDRL